MSCCLKICWKEPMKENLDQKILKLQKFFYEESAKRNILDKELKISKENLENLNSEIDNLEKVIILFQKSAEYAREQGKLRIEKLTTRILQYIFQKDYEFEIDIYESRNAPNADFLVVEKDEQTSVKTKPEISNGGGIVDIISLTLRLAFLDNFYPRIDGPLILDEPVKHVSEEFIFDIGDFLLNYSEKTERQIIMITHNNHLASLAENIYEVKKDESVSVVKKTNI